MKKLRGQLLGWRDLAEAYAEHAVPSFYFHLSHAYAILRHNGVDLGKRHYLGPLSRRDP